MSCKGARELTVESKAISLQERQVLLAVGHFFDPEQVAQLHQRHLGRVADVRAVHRSCVARQNRDFLTAGAAGRSAIGGPSRPAIGRRHRFSGRTSYSV